MKDYETVPPLLRGFGGLLGFVLVVLLDRLHRGADGSPDETFLVILGPGERGLARRVGAVDRGRHVALPKVVGLFRVLEIRPIVRELQEAAELALLLLKAADLRDGIVGRADDGDAFPDQGFERTVLGRLTAGDRRDAGEIVAPFLEAELAVLARLPARP